MTASSYGSGAGYSGSELKALALRWDGMTKERRETLWEEMSIRERKLLKRRLTKVDEQKLHDGESYVTKRQLAGYFGVHIETHLMPLAANLDEVARVVEHLALPWYVRLWRAVKRMITRPMTWAVTWLEGRGIRLYWLKQERDDADTDSGVPDQAGALRSQAMGAGEADRQFRGQAEGDRVPEGGGEDLRPDGSGTQHRERRAGAGKD